jgi:elongation factor 1 alpha-like protein
MSRHGKFYASLKHDDDDYDDYDDYDYDETYYEDEVKSVPKSNTASQQPASSLQQQGRGVAVSKPNVDSFGVPLDDPDYDLVGVQVKFVREIIGDGPAVGTILATLRSANYDLDSAVATLLGSPTTQGSPTFASTLPTPSTNGRVIPKPGGKKLKLGGVKETEPASPLMPASASVQEDDAPLPGINSPASPNSTKVLTRAQYGTASTIEDEDGRHTCTLVISGHVDSGKSTILGHLLYQLGHFSDRDVDRNEKDAKGTGKQSFKYAWLLDQSEEERRRGVTIDAGSHAFETPHKRVHVLDAPGHKDFVMNMISSATQADAALLVVTASVGEFESGLHHGTKEHLTILRTLGVGRILVAVNKMDTVDYSKDRYDDVVQQLMALMRQCKIKDADVMCFCPLSGMTGVNLTQADRAAIPWYTGPSLLDVIDTIPSENRLVDGPLRISLQDIQRQTLFGRIEAGKLTKGDTVLFVPSNIKVVIKGIDRPSGGGVVTTARAGETVELTTSSDLTGVYAGCVGCHVKQPVGAATEFECHIQTFGSLSNAVLPGSSFMLAVHALSVPVHVSCIVAKMDPKKGAWSTGMVKCVPKDSQAIVVLQSEFPLALEPAEVVRALGRFILRQGGETVAGGLITNLLKTN